jgi:hypothetical protein
VNDDWRLLVTLLDHAHADRLAGSLAASELEHEAVESLDDRVIVSRDGHLLFFYTDTREKANQVQRQIVKLAGDHNWEAQFELRRWHSTSEDWESPEEPLPATEEEVRGEREELMERERAESVKQGYPDFEVRVECASRHEAAALAERLEAEGVPNARRWRYLLVGALDEESAKQLVERLSAEAPDGAKVTVEGSAGATLNSRPSSPFAFLGGLGG